MGYYTDYKLETLDNRKIDYAEFLNTLKEGIRRDGLGRPEFLEVFEGALEDMGLHDIDDIDMDEEIASSGKHGIICMESDEECKWYVYRQEMKSISEMFPDIVFVLSGEGEESGDIWKEYFKNGKSQYAPVQMVFSEYDENLLK